MMRNNSSAAMGFTVISKPKEPVFCDVRERGFADRVSTDVAFAWIDGYSKIPDTESIAVESAVGRILAEPFLAPVNLPETDIAATDGYALRSCETVGAGSYNPLLFCLQDFRMALRPFSAALVSSGTPLPLGADAVAPFDLAQVAKTSLNVIGPVSEGEGVSRKGQDVAKGDLLIGTSRPLRASDVGLISSFGIDQVQVVRRPHVRVILAGSKPSIGQRIVDANGPMLRSKIQHDGGVIEIFKYGINSPAALANWITHPGADVIIICGRTGTGPDDEAPLALAEVGSVSIHGITVRPAGSTGLGSVGQVPVVLLPGSPLDCLCAYDLFAGRLIRNLSGRSSQLPYRVLRLRAGKKIVSSIGTTELCRVRILDGEAFPLGAADSGELASVARAHGFIIIPATMEGYAPGTPLTVYSYNEYDDAESS